MEEEEEEMKKFCGDGSTATSPFAGHSRSDVQPPKVTIEIQAYLFYWVRLRSQVSMKYGMMYGPDSYSPALYNLAFFEIWGQKLDKYCGWMSVL